MTNKELIIDCLIQDDEPFTQIVEFFKVIDVSISVFEIKKLLVEMINEGYVAINHAWKNEHDEYPYTLTDKGRKAWVTFDR
ncbi:MAG: hypothetical protein IKD26_06105 [Clostridia bacterium]|nr:hypothetical protein [Clostridia bacterium]